MEAKKEKTAERKFKQLVKFLKITKCDTVWFIKQMQIEKAILKEIRENPEVLTIQDENGMNLGMHCAKNGLEKVVLRCLEDETTCSQTDNQGRNIGMHCAINRLKKAMIKAMRNKYAYWHMDNHGYRIRDYALEFLDLEEIKIIEEDIMYHWALNEISNN